jgi:hypothetical protein
MGDLRNLAVVTVFLNDKAGLVRTVASIRAQSVRPKLHVLVDGGSSDGSQDIAYKVGQADPATLFVPGPDQGIYDGMNRGLACVPAGWLVWFLNSGDFLIDRDALHRTWTAATQSQAWTGGPMVVVRPSGRAFSVATAADSGSIPAQPSIVADADLLKSAGGFRTDLKYASDGVLYQNLTSICPPTIYPIPSVAFMLGGRSSRNIATTLTEFHSAQLAGDSSALRALRRNGSVLTAQFKTRFRDSLLDLEVKRPSRLLTGALDRFHATSSLLTTPHWPHSRWDERDFSCCLRELGSSLRTH